MFASSNRIEWRDYLPKPFSFAQSFISVSLLGRDAVEDILDLFVRVISFVSTLGAFYSQLADLYPERTDCQASHVSGFL